MTWLGLAPRLSSGGGKPTLILSDGGDYVMKWVNGDGATDNLQIWDDTESLIGDLTTEDVREVGERASLAFTANSGDGQLRPSVPPKHADR